MILRIKNVNFDYFNYRVETIDSFFIDNYNKKNIYVENNLSKISLFSYDKYSREKKHFFGIYDNFGIYDYLKNHLSKREINNLLLIASSVEKSTTERYLFKNNTLRFPYNNNDIDFNDGNFNFIKTENKNFISLILKFLKMNTNLYKSISIIKIFFYFLFYLFLLSILFFIKPYQNQIVYFKKKLKIRHSLFKIYFKVFKTIRIF